MIKAVAVGFDGVIHNADQGWQDGIIYGDTIPGALETLRELMQVHPVFIMTARPDLEPVADWFTERGFTCVYRETKERWNTRGTLLITNRKLPAIAYIDDKGIRFTDWKGAAAEIDIMSALAPKADELARIRRESEAMFIRYILDKAADCLYSVQPNKPQEFEEGVRWAVRELRRRSETGDLELAVGFDALCEYCGQVIRIERQRTRDEEYRAWVCNSCMAPGTADYLNNPPF